MKISTKGRYGLASMIYLSQFYDNKELLTITKISDNLGISKIYLEQVFSLLKRNELVKSSKGSQGGYILASAPENISVYDILNAAEPSLFDKTELSVIKNSKEIEEAMHKLVYSPLDKLITNNLKSVSLKELKDKSEKLKNANSYMFYI